MKRYRIHKHSCNVYLKEDPKGKACLWEDVKKHLKKYRELNRNYKSLQQANEYLKKLADNRLKALKK